MSGCTVVASMRRSQNHLGEPGRAREIMANGDGARRHSYWRAVLLRRVLLFRRLLFAILVAILIFSLSGQGREGSPCLSWWAATFAAGVLEFIAGYFIAGIAVSVITIQKNGPFEADLGPRLGLLGASGFFSALLAAVSLIGQRCS